jgi:hypothetical protein
MSRTEPHGLRELSNEQRQRVTGWRQRIWAEWQKQVHTTLEIGRLLSEAHDDLIGIRGAWAAMVANDLPFDRTTAQRYMEIWRNPVLSNVAHGQQLPASWRTLYELTKFDDDTLRNLIATGQITPRTERKDVEQLRRTIAAGKGIATITHDNSVAYAMSQWQAATTRAFNFTWDRLTHGPMTDEELAKVVETCATIAGQIDGFIDAVGKFRVEPMRTVYRPEEWDDPDDQSNQTLDADTRRSEAEGDTGT